MWFFVSVFLIASFEILKLDAETLLCQLRKQKKTRSNPTQVCPLVNWFKGKVQPESRIFHGKNYSFWLRFSLKPIYWLWIQPCLLRKYSWYDFGGVTSSSIWIHRQWYRKNDIISLPSSVWGQLDLAKMEVTHYMESHHEFLWHCPVMRTYNFKSKSVEILLYHRNILGLSFDFAFPIAFRQTRPFQYRILQNPIISYGLSSLPQFNPWTTHQPTIIYHLQVHVHMSIFQWLKAYEIHYPLVI